MDDKTLVTYSLAVIKKTGKYVRAYNDWLAKTEDQQTYVCFNDFWRNEHLNTKRSNLVAHNCNYGGSATKTGGKAEKNEIQQWLEQCANTMMVGQQQQQQQ